ncbi:MAG TPA: hypothetical protein VK886_04230, partial [Vicinamibacterales bacterium]|nr:hypothetical protein [Vicinamibacterales bacterium]
MAAVPQQSQERTREALPAVARALPGAGSARARTPRVVAAGPQRALGRTRAAAAAPQQALGRTR